MSITLDNLASIEEILEAYFEEAGSFRVVKTNDLIKLREQIFHDQSIVDDETLDLVAQLALGYDSYVDLDDLLFEITLKNTVL